MARTIYASDLMGSGLGDRGMVVADFTVPPRRGCYGSAEGRTLSAINRVSGTCGGIADGWGMFDWDDVVNSSGTAHGGNPRELEA